MSKNKQHTRKGNKLNLFKRYEDRIFPEPNTGCWLWTGQLSNRGYGKVTVNRKTIGLHRLFYTIFNGKVPLNMLVMHSCDVRCCVNPDHLSAGKPKDNMQDKIKKCREYRGFGEGNGMSLPLG